MKKKALTKTCLFSPSKKDMQSSAMTAFRHFLNKKHHQRLQTEEDLYRFSIENTALFWDAFQQFSNILWIKKPTQIVDNPQQLPGATWFKGARLNYAQNLLKGEPNAIAIYDIHENKTRQLVSYQHLKEKCYALQQAFLDIGIKKGSMVSAIMPNCSETVSALLATASLGAIWSSCSPELGFETLKQRLSQVQTQVLIACSSYEYKGKTYDITQKTQELLHQLPSITHVIFVTNKAQPIQTQTQQKICLYSDLIDTYYTKNPALHYEAMAFMDPGFILFSSGSTGKPKCIVHSVGGTLIQHLKEHLLHCNITEKSNLFYYTTCSWMMFNWLVGALATGCCITLYEGAPFYPKKEALFQLIDAIQITHFGISAKYLQEAQKLKIKPKQNHPLDSLYMILSTGSPLAPSQFDYVYTHIKSKCYLCSISGGSDIISCFVLGNPNLPVYKGYIQSKGLGMDVACYNAKGESVIEEEGELVCRKACPSMPIGFLNDPKNKRFYDAYFNTYPSTWHHGDYMIIDAEGSIQILGRSDTTLNPGGIRIGTAEIYEALDQLEDIQDSLIVGKKITHPTGNDEIMICFISYSKDVYPKDPKDASYAVDPSLENKIKQTIKNLCSVWHLPKYIFQVSQIPYTHNGKKVEKSIKQLLETKNLDGIDTTALLNPEALEDFLIVSQTI